MEELQVLRWINNHTVEQSAWIYHKFDNTRGSDYARAGSVELDANGGGVGRYLGRGGVGVR